MPLIDITPPQPVDPLASGIIRITQQSNAIYRQLAGLLSNASRFVWQNPSYTPQQVMSAFGTSGAQLFELSSLTAEIVSTVTGQPVRVVPDGWTYQIVQDGNVTLNGPTGSVSSGSTTVTM